MVTVSPDDSATPETLRPDRPACRPRGGAWWRTASRACRRRDHKAVRGSARNWSKADPRALPAGTRAQGQGPRDAPRASAVRQEAVARKDHRILGLHHLDRRVGVVVENHRTGRSPRRPSRVRPSRRPRCRNRPDVCCRGGGWTPRRRRNGIVSGRNARSGAIWASAPNTAVAIRWFTTMRPATGAGKRAFTTLPSEATRSPADSSPNWRECRTRAPPGERSTRPSRSWRACC